MPAAVSGHQRSQAHERPDDVEQNDANVKDDYRCDTKKKRAAEVQSQVQRALGVDAFGLERDKSAEDTERTDD